MNDIRSYLIPHGDRVARPVTVIVAASTGPDKFTQEMAMTADNAMRPHLAHALNRPGVGKTGRVVVEFDG